MDEKVKVTFDAEYRVRVLEPEVFSRGEKLEKEINTFTDKISSFNDKVNSVVDVLEQHANRIDEQKLRAIGLRIANEREAEQRKALKKNLEVMLYEKKGELERLVNNHRDNIVSISITLFTLYY